MRHPTLSSNGLSRAQQVPKLTHSGAEKAAQGGRWLLQKQDDTLKILTIPAKSQVWRHVALIPALGSRDQRILRCATG